MVKKNREQFTELRLLGEPEELDSGDSKTVVIGKFAAFMATFFSFPASVSSFFPKHIFINGIFEYPARLLRVWMQDALLQK